MIVPRKSGRENRARAYDVEKRYEAAATEIEKIVVIRTYIDELLADDPNLRRLRREVEATMGVVPAALDYGMLLIQYAQLDPEQRGRDSRPRSACSSRSRRRPKAHRRS